jgi:hypothetical protein
MVWPNYGIHAIITTTVEHVSQFELPNVETAITSFTQARNKSRLFIPVYVEPGKTPDSIDCCVLGCTGHGYHVFDIYRQEKSDEILEYRPSYFTSELIHKDPMAVWYLSSDYIYACRRDQLDNTTCCKMIDVMYKIADRWIEKISGKDKRAVEYELTMVGKCYEEALRFSIKVNGLRTSTYAMPLLKYVVFMYEYWDLFPKIVLKVARLPNPIGTDGLQETDKVMIENTCQKILAKI